MCTSGDKSFVFLLSFLFSITHGDESGMQFVITESQIYELEKINI